MRQVGGNPKRIWQTPRRRPTFRLALHSFHQVVKTPYSSPQPSRKDQPLSLHERRGESDDDPQKEAPSPNLSAEGVRSAKRRERGSPTGTAVLGDAEIV